MSINKNILKTKKPGLFKPKITRIGDQSFFSNPVLSNKDSIKKYGNTNIQSTSSFRYNDKNGLISTQQLNVDYSKFENHTFFHSAVAKTNEAFDNIINRYPFDGDQKTIEEFEDNLTGFEKYVLDSFPNNVGYLNFSASNSKGPHISVKDGTGAVFTNISRNKKGSYILNPDANPFTIEMHLNVPEQSNDKQIIFQKMSTISNGITIALSESSSANDCNLVFGITSGSNHLFLTASLTKGKFHHIAAIYDKDNEIEQKLFLYVDIDNVYSSSISQNFTKLSYGINPITIGSGSAIMLNDDPNYFTPTQTLTASIDELRYFKEKRSILDLKRYKNRNLNKNTLTGDTNNLIFYYKFNEPHGNYIGNNVILDSSGNSLHQTITNFSIENRLTGSDAPLKHEKKSNNIVLFPDFGHVKTFNQTLMTTASFYDNVNPNLITKLIPSHYFLEGNEQDDFSTILGTFNENITGGDVPGSLAPKSAQLLTIFLLIWGKYFDELKLFIDAVSNLKNIDYENFNTTPDALLYDVGKFYGIELPSLFKNANVEQLIDGINVTENISGAKLSLIKIQNVIWRQILASVPYLKTSKGTIESIKSVFRSSGIEPDNIFTIREYGGNSERDIDDSKEAKIDILKFLNFSGSLANIASSLGTHGRPDNKPSLMSGFLSGSRIEAGEPRIRGAYVANNTFHGISNNPSDGLFTSGSFTYEGQYYFNKNEFYTSKQSLARLHTTGSVATGWEGVIANLTYNSSSNVLNLDVLDSITESTKSSLSLNNLNLINSEIWNISFGYDRQGNIEQSGSIFLRAGRSEAGKLYDYHATASFVTASSDSLFSNINSAYNASGSMICIGSQSIDNSQTVLLNKDSVVETHFAGLLSNIRFFSKATTENEFKSHIKNPQSVGTTTPLKNYLFAQTLSGSFEKLRLTTDSKQGTTASNSSGNFRLFDFSQNNLHLEGTGFESNKIVVNPVYKEYSFLSSNFDISIADSKIRIRTLKNLDRIAEHKYARTSPVFEVFPGELTIDDPRFSIDMSIMKGLNEQIMKIFSDFDFLSDALGKTNTMFAETYPDLKSLRELYFKNVLEKIDIGKYSELFKWIDTSLSNIITDLIPHTAKFKGINFVYENHVLDRNKFKYHHDQMYQIGEPLVSATNSILNQSSGGSVGIDIKVTE